MSQRSANITAQKETFIQKYKKRNQGARVFGLVQMHVCVYIVCVKKEASVVRPPPSRRQWSECSKETLERAQRRCECPCELPNEPGSLKQAALNAFRLHTVGFASAGCHLSSSRNTPSTPLHLQPVKRCVVCPGQKVSVWHEQSLIACNGCKVKSETIERVQIIFLKQSLRKMYALNLKYNIVYNFVSVCFQPGKVCFDSRKKIFQEKSDNLPLAPYPHIPIFFIRYLKYSGIFWDI